MYSWHTLCRVRKRLEDFVRNKDETYINHIICIFYPIGCAC